VAHTPASGAEAPDAEDIDQSPGSAGGKWYEYGYRKRVCPGLIEVLIVRKIKVTSHMVGAAP